MHVRLRALIPHICKRRRNRLDEPGELKIGDACRLIFELRNLT